MWSGVYPPGSSLQHAAQLQLLSQQQMLRQQELLMIQQHTAQVLELQRNAQLVVSGFKTCAKPPIIMPERRGSNMDGRWTYVPYFLDYNPLLSP